MNDNNFPSELDRRDESILIFMAVLTPFAAHLNLLF